ncbi:MAG: M20/M25/M40 family metallo-hydrolase [Anaerolineales bacterium]|nr:M20/M25/M40 family metallo-hydrolase [Anaerolineales bacterium]
MDAKKLKEHLIELIEMHGPSGHEEPIRAYLREQWSGLVEDFEVDGLGSLVGIKRGIGPEPRKRIMLCAHMDEIGQIVTEVKDGYLRLGDIHGTDSRITLAKPVVVLARGGALKGVVAVPPPHITRQQSGTPAYIDHRDQWVDLGLPAEEVARLVRVGDLVTMDAPAVELMGDLIAGKAMDDRACVAAVTACLHYLQGRTHEWDVVAVASTQEEMGLYGARAAAYHVHPDLAIALDVSFAEQSGVNGDDHVKLGEGPQLAIGPNLHDGAVKGVLEAAKRLEMKVPIEAAPGMTGTDAAAIQVSHEGIPTVLLEVPIRNMHSPVETVSLKDIDRAGRLMAEFITGLTPDYLDTIAWKPEEDEENKNGDQS